MARRGRAGWRRHAGGAGAAWRSAARRRGSVAPSGAARAVATTSPISPHRTLRRHNVATVVESPPPLWRRLTIVVQSPQPLWRRLELGYVTISNAPGTTSRYDRVTWAALIPNSATTDVRRPDLCTFSSRHPWQNARLATIGECSQTAHNRSLRSCTAKHSWRPGSLRTRFAGPEATEHGQSCIAEPTARRSRRPP